MRTTIESCVTAVVERAGKPVPLDAGSQLIG